jgi:hypothetical protein
MGAAASIEKAFVANAVEMKCDEQQTTQLSQGDAVDIFAREMYLSSPKIDALQYVLSSEAGRDAFLTFLRTEFADENLTFFIVSTLHEEYFLIFHAFFIQSTAILLGCRWPQKDEWCR